MSARRRPQSHFLSLAVCAVLAVACGESQPPNVVLLTLDTTRADYLSSYGHPRRTTPHLDSLIEGGTRFDLAIATASVTNVSHASILTGLDNPDHGVRVLSAHGGYRLPNDIPTLATLLREAGYRTIAVHSAFPVSAHFGFERGFDVFESLEAEIRVTGRGRRSHSWDTSRHQRRSDVTTDLALEHLRDAVPPFLLWVHYWDPHDASLLPPEGRRPPDRRIYEQVAGQRVLIRPNPALYEAEVSYMDDQIGRLLEGLRERGLFERSVIAAVADHGQGLGQHGWAGHRLLYQEHIRVPLLLRVPGWRQRPSVPDLVRTTDLLPTLLDRLGIDPPRPLSGRSLRPLLEGEREAPRVAFAEQLNGFDLNALLVRSRPLDDFLYAVTDARWKLIYRPTRPEKSELYDLASDPGEIRNLYTPDHPEAVRLEELLARRAAWVTEPFAADGEIDAGVVRALESLGYAAGATQDAPIEWAWTCPEHKGEVRGEPRPCPRCHRPPLLIQRPSSS